MEPRPLYELDTADEAAMAKWATRLRLGEISVEELVKTAAWATHQPVPTNAEARAIWQRVPPAKEAPPVATAA